MSDFGNLPLKLEGAAAHPDAYGIGYGNGDKFGDDERYLRQLQAYADWHGVEETLGSHTHIVWRVLPRLRNLPRGGLELRARLTSYPVKPVTLPPVK